ncbi:MAG TPA: type II toxin-antitoxin system VapC family toxin [Bryobacteraceae bacterium]|jgi:predicted nucleic acid-binding protein
MAVLTDTNIFLRLLQPHHPHCPVAERALDALRVRRETLNVTSQNLVELWAAATRPFTENGLGLTAEQAVRELEQVKRFWTLLPEVPLHEEWERLVKMHRVSGRNTHDARLVAAMRLHGIEKILTFNMKDFARYTTITVLDPADVG